MPHFERVDTDYVVSLNSSGLVDATILDIAVDRHHEVVHVLLNQQLGSAKKNSWNDMEDSVNELRQQTMLTVAVERYIIELHSVSPR